LFIIAPSLGLRKGEVAGLRPEDVDLAERQIHVRRALAWMRIPGAEKGGWVEREPKQNSARTLPMTETIYRALVRHLANRAREATVAKDVWQDSGYLFVSPIGQPLHSKNLNAAFHALCDRAGVPRLRFHDTRHTCGTLLHAQGADAFITADNPRALPTFHDPAGHARADRDHQGCHRPAGDCVQQEGREAGGAGAAIRARD
jgi:integrase